MKSVIISAYYDAWKPTATSIEENERENFMEKIKVEICCGTACYLLGAANLMSIEDEIPAEFRDKVEIEARTCLELCEKENLGGAPYVRFNGEEIMAQATNEKVLAGIEELVGGAA